MNKYMYMYIYIYMCMCIYVDSYISNVNIRIQCIGLGLIRLIDFISRLVFFSFTLPFLLPWRVRLASGCPILNRLID